MFASDFLQTVYSSTKQILQMKTFLNVTWHEQCLHGLNTLTSRVWWSCSI